MQVPHIFIVILLKDTDPFADNYNEDATVNDGSCSGYPEDGV